MKKALFKERQHSKSKDEIVIVFLFLILSIFALAKQLMYWDGFDSKVILSIVLIASLTFWLKILVTMKLKVSISEKSIKFKMDAIQSKSQKIKWKHIDELSIVRTPLFAQWHGGNITFDRTKKFTLSGRNGVSLTTKDGERYFIGSRRLDELENAIHTVMNLQKRT